MGSLWLWNWGVMGVSLHKKCSLTVSFVNVSVLFCLASMDSECCDFYMILLWLTDEDLTLPKGAHGGRSDRGGAVLPCESLVGAGQGRWPAAPRVSCYVSWCGPCPWSVCVCVCGMCVCVCVCVWLVCVWEGMVSVCVCVCVFRVCVCGVSVCS